MEVYKNPREQVLLDIQMGEASYYGFLWVNGESLLLGELMCYGQEVLEILQ